MASCLCLLTVFAHSYTRSCVSKRYYITHLGGNASTSAVSICVPRGTSSAAEHRTALRVGFAEVKCALPPRRSEARAGGETHGVTKVPHVVAMMTTQR